MRYFLQTYGCQMNRTDSERISAVVENMGYSSTDDMDRADLVLFNTCSIRQKAEDRVHGSIGKTTAMRKKNPRLRVGVTGCMIRKSSSQNSEDKDELLKVHKNLDFVFRIEDLGKLDGVILETAPDLDIQKLDDNGTVENYFKIHPKYETDFKAYVPIQSGCDKFCTYCIVPFTRGREYSRSFQEILDECERLVKSGVKEITLVGQTVNTYGISRFDKMSKNFESYGKYPFVDLLVAIDKLKSQGLKWLRFTSPHPKDFSDDLIQAMADLETVCSHVHMPVQSGCNEGLKAMNRNYSIEEYLVLVEKFRKVIPGISISTDIIVGFCGETEQMFNETCEFYNHVGFDMCYHARYSARKGTYSDKWFADDVTTEDKAKRWRALNVLIKQNSFKFLKPFEGKIEEILIDEIKGEYYYGRNSHNKTVRLKSEKTNLIGKFVSVKVERALEWLLEASLV